MGRAVAETVERADGLALAGVWARGDDLDALLEKADVVIDFSLPEGTMLVLDAARRHDKPLVCGVSGLSAEQLEELKDTATSVCVVYDRNMSLGIAVLERSVREAAASLGSEFAVRVAEVHHVHKRDAPSGTALKLAEAVADARGEPDTGSVEFEVERRGEVPGDHEVTLETPAERLSFAHSVTTRQVFADGAVRAARWVVGKPAGLYGMRDVLFDDNRAKKPR